MSDATVTMAGEKRRVAASSVVAAVAITSLKAVVGITTGSLGILSEALHSALDLVAAVITLISVRMSDQPADEGHHYGHGKFENFSAFIETALLALTSVWIVFEAGKRLLFQSVEVEPSIAALLVMGFSIVTDFWRSRALKRVADKYQSQALEADALHFRTDIWSSCAVIVGLVVVWAGRQYHVPALRAADPIAALFVAVIVMTVTWRLGRQTVEALVDAAPAGMHDAVVRRVGSLPGVLSVEDVRIRRAGNRTFVEVAVALARTLSFERSGSFSSEVAAAVHLDVPNADVIVRAIPRESTDESLFDRVRTIAARHGVSVRDLAITDFDGALDLELYLEFDGVLTLKVVHDRVNAIEQEVSAGIPKVRSVVTHVGPASGIAKGAEQVYDARLEAELRAAAMEIDGIVDAHEFRIRRIGDQLDVSCHCLLADDLSLTRVHEICAAAEQRLRARDARLGRIVLHPEPASEEQP
jgi:cation diffusion facilitator family transporter